MQQITIGTKNQVVIPLSIRNQISGIKPGRKVIIYSLSSDTVAIKVTGQSWLESSYGVMKKFAQKSPSIDTLEEQRDEWDEK